MSVEKVLMFDDGNVRLVAEFWKRDVFIHVRVKKWSKSVRAMMLARWVAMRLALNSVKKGEVYAYFSASDPRLPRFARLFGFFEIKRNNEWILTKEHGHA